MKKGFETEVDKLPDCDFCTEECIGTDSHYDGLTIYGSWANMCQGHFDHYGTGLGMGRGQRLIVSSKFETTKSLEGSNAKA